jgi:NlpC/P60 family/Transglycosylase SLT domain
MSMLPQSNQEHSSNFFERQLQQLGGVARRKLLKKGAKIALKLAKKAAMKFAILLTKLLGWLASLIGLPVVIAGLIMVVVLIVISLSWTFLMSTGEGLEGEDKALHMAIKQAADSTVDMSNALERPYRVPEGLIAATAQLDVFKQKNMEKQVIEKMARALAPVFTYRQYDEWTEKQVDVCEDGVCKEGKVVRTSKMVTKLDHVEYWNGTTTFTYTAHITPWNKKVDTSYKTVKETVEKDKWFPVWVSPNITDIMLGSHYYDKNSKQYATLLAIQERQSAGIEGKPPNAIKVYIKKTVKEIVERKVKVEKITWTRKQYFTSSQSSTSDYAKLDSILNSFGLGIEDKKLIEANYLFTGGTIAYTEWLGYATGNWGGGAIGGIGYSGNIIPGAGVPPQFMPFYLGAEQVYGVHWYVLAAIHFVETTFSSSPHMISSAGAIGPMQFLPATWAGWSYNIGGGLVSSNVDITSIAVISRGGGYGVDGCKDGKADPWDNCDAIYSAAHYLSRNGYSTDPRGAIWHYNHADWYVNKVLKKAEEFKAAATYEGGGSIREQVATVGNKWIGHSVYVWGGGRNQYDISHGRFDCSAFVHWAFAQVGVDLGPLGSTSTETLNKKGTRVSINEAQIGDIIFFDTYKKDGHVGIYLGNGKFIGCQGSTGVAIVDINNSQYYKSRFSGHIRRVLP